MKRYIRIKGIYIFFIFLLLAEGERMMAQTLSADLVRWHAIADPYLEKVKKQPDWLFSRLQMYWQSHATDIFVSGEVFDHAGGERAPVPTVRFNGSRSSDGIFFRPKLADVVPYDDDDAGDVTFLDSKGKKERVNPSKTGTAIAGINHEILSIAVAAARIYHATQDTIYARMAADVFRVYMNGLFYRSVPLDLNHGHIQTLMGLTTFEVIHENAIYDVTALYANLKDYLDPHQFKSYDATLKKWAENEIHNGVPHNNWDLFQTEFIVRIALTLRSDSFYADHRGQEYYIDYVLYRSSVRQWSLKKLCNFGFDENTGIWYESPGYAMTVLGELGKIAGLLDEKTGYDMFRQIPVIKKAFMASSQYLFPNRMIVGFGDTHPGYLNTDGIRVMQKYAVRCHYSPLQASLDSFLQAVQPQAPDSLIMPYVSPVFFAPNVSWLVLRSGMDRNHDLMISLNGSMGNHQHANGISMELYGKGYVLGPDAGIGKQLYSGADYIEYYSQFPAHNTVCVDGISAYPVMMSHHPFKVRHRYPSDNNKRNFSPVVYSEVEFMEPESRSRQVRTNAIIKTSKTGGYYIDIFRSRKMEGGDKMHDYFYHNLGQILTVTRSDGSALDWHSTDQLAFAGGHLYAYSYLFHKVYVETESDIHAAFVTKGRNGRHIVMNLWMEGDKKRKIIKALSPVNMEYNRIPDSPYDISSQPVLTYIARQTGEAWNHPFVAVYEPETDKEPSEIENVSYFHPESKDMSAVGICVKLKNGRTDYIFSSVEGEKMHYNGMTVKGGFAVFSNDFILKNDQYCSK